MTARVATHPVQLATAVAAALATFVVASPVHAADRARPDIDRVEVKAAPGGVLQFRIVYAKPVVLPPTSVLDVFLDADDDTSTGEEGFEVAVDYSSAPDGSAYVSLFHGDEERRPEALEFHHDGRSSTFTVPVVELGFPDAFDYSFAFYVLIEVDGDLADAAPSHVLVSPAAKPFAVDGRELFAHDHLTYEDLADSTPAEDPRALLWVVGVVFGLGAVLAVVGWSVEKLRRTTSRRRLLDGPP